MLTSAALLSARSGCTWQWWSLCRACSRTSCSPWTRSWPPSAATRAVPPPQQPPPPAPRSRARSRTRSPCGSRSSAASASSSAPSSPLSYATRDRHCDCDCDLPVLSAAADRAQSSESAALLWLPMAQSVSQSVSFSYTPYCTRCRCRCRCCTSTLPPMQSTLTAHLCEFLLRFFFLHIGNRVSALLNRCPRFLLSSSAMAALLVCGRSPYCNTSAFLAGSLNCNYSLIQGAHCSIVQ